MANAKDIQRIIGFFRRLQGYIREINWRKRNGKKLTDGPGFLPSRPLGVKGTISRKEIYDYLDDPTRHPYPAGKEPA